MDTIQCAVVLAKLERFEWEVEQRVQIGARYNAILDEKGIKRVVQRSDRTSVFAQYTVVLNDREKTQKVLAESNIPTAVHYPVPLNEQPAYRALCDQTETPVSRKMAKEVMSLPMHPYLTEEEQKYVACAIEI